MFVLVFLYSSMVGISPSSWFCCSCSCSHFCVLCFFAVAVAVAVLAVAAAGVVAAAVAEDGQDNLGKYCWCRFDGPGGPSAPRSHGKGMETVSERERGKLVAENTESHE